MVEVFEVWCGVKFEMVFVLVVLCVKVDVKVVFVL